MPRKRDPNKPIKERARLETVEQINSELRRTYRLFVNKQITHAEMSRRRELLVALRAGLPESVERPKPGVYFPTAVHIFSVPSGFFMSPAQIEAQKRGEPIVDVNQCTLLQLGREPPLLEHASQLEPDESAIECAPPELKPEPEPELSPTMRRAMAMGYTPLPRRVRPVD